MEERQICCCGSRVWTQVIAWLHIIGSFFFICGNGYALVVSNGGQNIAPIVTSFVVSVLSIIMGIILLHGSTNRNPRQIGAWIVYAIILLVIFGVMDVALAIITGDVIYPLVEFVILLILEGFCLWVVTIHKKEIEATGTV